MQRELSTARQQHQTHRPAHTPPLLQERRFAQLEDALAARESKREAYLVVS